MKILKSILIALLVIVVISGIGIYFLPKDYTVTNSIEINKPIDVVYAQLSNFNTWGAWDPWRVKDPDAKVVLEGTPGAKGHKMSWDGQKLGEGNLTISWCEPNKSIHSDLAFVRPAKMEAKDVWQLEADGDKTKVTWINSGGLPYPLGRLFGLTVDKMLSNDHNEGLNNLKKYCEAIVTPQPMATTDSDSTVTAGM